MCIPSQVAPTPRRRPTERLGNGSEISSARGDLSGAAGWMLWAQRDPYWMTDEPETLPG
ncbi:hypothetical protein GCM10009798_20740 [Nocardioides panacihumi]|uniref:Uncharacterized protein n=1 Tax=Nocardioides panacihumi TaxID=400774 RepID=A0ABP5CAU4_9ACTN